MPLDPNQPIDEDAILEGAGEVLDAVDIPEGIEVAIPEVEVPVPEEIVEVAQPTPIDELQPFDPFQADTPGGIQRLFATIPDSEIEKYNDFLHMEDQKLVIRSTTNFSPPRFGLAPQMYDDTTGWFETVDAGAQLGFVARAVRRTTISVQNAFGEKTQLDRDEVNAYIFEHGDKLSERIRLRKNAGRYNGVHTKEALIRLLSYDMMMDELADKAAKGSAWAFQIGQLADFAVIEIATLGTGGLIGAGVKAGGAAIQGTAAGAGLVIRARQGVRAAKMVKTGVHANRLAKANAVQRGMNRFTPLTIKGIPYEALAAIGTQAGVSGTTLSQSSNLAARLWKSSAVRAGAFAGGGVFIQQGGIHMLDDERTWGDIGLNTAMAAAGGVLLGSVASGAFFKGLRRVVRGPKGEAGKLAAKGVTPKVAGVVTRLDSGGNIIADLTKPFALPEGFGGWMRFMTPFIRNPFTAAGMRMERFAGRLFVNTGMPIEAAEFLAQVIRPLGWGIPVYAAANAFGFSPSLMGLEGILDKFKMDMARDIGTEVRGEDKPLSSGASLTFPDFDNRGRQASHEVMLARAKEVPGMTEENAIKWIFEGFESTEAEIAKDEAVKDWNNHVTESALVFHAQEFQDELMLSANDINQLVGPPDEFRKWAQAYRDNIDRVMSGDTIGEMLEEMSYLVAEGHEMVEQQAAIEQRFSTDIGHIDQTNLLGSVDEQGLEMVGNQTVRMIASSLAKMLDAKADGNLQEVAVALADDPLEWIRDAAEQPLHTFSQEMARVQAYAIDWQGRYIDTENGEIRAYQVLLEGRAKGSVNRMVANVATEEDLMVHRSLNAINLSNLYKSYSLALKGNLPVNADKVTLTHAEIDRVAGYFAASPPPKDEQGFFASIGEFVSGAVFDVMNPKMKTAGAATIDPNLEAIRLRDEANDEFDRQEALKAQAEPTDVPEFTETVDVPTDIPSFEP